MAQTPEEVAARQAIEAQHLARDDRLLASERATVDSAKLVSTFVADRGVSSERNRSYLRQGDHAYIIGEKLRSDSEAGSFTISSHCRAVIGFAGPGSGSSAGNTDTAGTEPAAGATPRARASRAQTERVLIAGPTAPRTRRRCHRKTVAGVIRW